MICNVTYVSVSVSVIHMHSVCVVCGLWSRVNMGVVVKKHAGCVQVYMC